MNLLPIVILTVLSSMALRMLIGVLVGWHLRDIREPPIRREPVK